MASIVLCVVFSSYMYIYHDFSPMWDMVHVIDFLRAGSGGLPLNLLSFDVLNFEDNEHKPFILFIFWWLDDRIFASGGVIPVVSSYILVIVTTVLVTSWVWKKITHYGRLVR